MSDLSAKRDPAGSPCLPVLETERLRLRPLLESDAEALHVCRGDPEVAKYLVFSSHETLEDTRRWLSWWLTEGYGNGDAAWAVEEQGRVVGFADAWKSADFPGFWEMGYWFARNAWGKGFATEALRAVLTYLREQAGQRRFAAEYAVENPASGRVLKKMGFREAQSGSYETADGILLQSRVCFLEEEPPY